MCSLPAEREREERERQHDRCFIIDEAQIKDYRSIDINNCLVNSLCLMKCSKVAIDTHFQELLVVNKKHTAEREQQLTRKKRKKTRARRRNKEIRREAP